VSFSLENVIKRAKRDLAQRLGVKENEIEVDSTIERDFPNASLGAPLKDEVSMQMISSGWQIDLVSGGKTFEYRADKYQLRICGFKGKNYIIES